MNRFFVPKEQIPIITGSDAHQIKNVLRLKPGAEIELLDGRGNVYFARIRELATDKVTCEIISTQQADSTAKIKITLAQCLPKAKKMDLIIQKCTELGAAEIIPVLSERSIAKGDKNERWQKIAKEAAEQSGRTTIPKIAPLTNLADVLKVQADLKLIPWELENQESLKEALISKYPNIHSPITQSPDILILIGPEGGFSKSEVNQASLAGFIAVSLGKNILRTETAGLAALAMINYQFDL
ncbi:MAG: 16S rRNA (uracil(1498)-N(3))-methyltransferase [bacterium]